MLDFLRRLFSKKEKQNVQYHADVDETSVPVYTDTLKLCVMGNGSRVNYEPGGMYGAKCLWWVSEETNEDGAPVYIRESSEKTMRLPALLPFTAAGKLYANLSQLSPQYVID